MISPNSQLPAPSWNLFEPRLPAEDMPLWAGISSVTLDFDYAETIEGEDYSYSGTATYSATVTTRRELGGEDDGLSEGEFDILGSDVGPSHALGATVRAIFAPQGVIGSFTLTDGAGTTTGDIEDFGSRFNLRRCSEVHPGFTDLGEREARKCEASGLGVLFGPPTDGWADLITGGSVTFLYELEEETVLGLRNITVTATITLA